MGEKVNEALAAGGLHYDPGTLDIRHLLDVIINDIGLDAHQAKVVKPLQGTARRALPRLHGPAPRL
ncbi:MAG: hypothetical protein MZV49_25350 [Rhodopseudomonas palustris]|nr:hypothetical protein [Rhodopseudomonas palustris]